MKLHELILSVFIVALISFVSCEKEEEFIKVTDISININSVIIVEGDTLMINAMVVPSNASNKNLSWSSSNDNIVTVDNSGLISAKNVGEATITVSTQDGNRSAVVSIKVIESWISLSQNVIESSLNGGTYEVSLGSSSAWSIVSIPQWVTVSPTIGGTTGLDSTKVNIEVSRFVGTSLNRSGDIIFKLNNRNRTDTLKVNQHNYQLSDGDYVKVQNSTAGDGIDLVFLGDGYTIEDVVAGKFNDNLYEAIDHFFDIEPYRAYRNYFDVYIVYAFSEDSGISDIETTKKTKFSAKYESATSTRMSIDHTAVFEYAEKAPLSADLTETQITVITNSFRYAGTNWSYSDGMSISGVPVSNLSYPNDFRGLVQHEAGGHGFGQLADEYTENGSTIPESDKEELQKWQAWGFFENVDITNRPEDVLWKHLINDPAYSYVGIHEGGYYYAKGVWRSEPVSLMTDNIRYINAQGRDQIVKRIKQLAGETYSYEEFKRKDVRETQALTRSVTITTDESLKLPSPILIEVK